METVTIGNDRLQIYTDFIQFKDHSKSNSNLLIYWIKDLKDSRPRLITAFPVQENFLKLVFDPTKLGPDQEIKIRYNGLSIALGQSYPKPLKGLRVKMTGPK